MADPSPNITNICFYISLIVSHPTSNASFNSLNNMPSQDNFSRQREREGTPFPDNLTPSPMPVDLASNDSPATLHAASSQTPPLFPTLADASDLQGIEKVGLELSEKAQGKQRNVAVNQPGLEEEGGEGPPTISPTSVYFNIGPSSDLAGKRATKTATPALLSRATTPSREMSVHLEKYLESPTNPRREFMLSPQTSFPKRVKPHSSDPSLVGRASSASSPIMLRPPPPPVPERINRLAFLPNRHAQLCEDDVPEVRAGSVLLETTAKFPTLGTFLLETHCIGCMNNDEQSTETLGVLWSGEKVTQICKGCNLVRFCSHASVAFISFVPCNELWMTKKLMRIVQNCWMKEGESHLQECLGLAKAIRENNIPSTLVRLVVKIFREQRRNPVSWMPWRKKGPLLTMFLDGNVSS